MLSTPRRQKLKMSDMSNSGSAPPRLISWISCSRDAGSLAMIPVGGEKKEQGYDNVENMTLVGTHVNDLFSVSPLL